MNAVTTESSPVAIELVALIKRFGQGHPAVDNINLRIASGTYCCLLGPSGCGTAMMFQSFALFPHLSALDNVAFSLSLSPAQWEYS
jgi:putative spermidine/putrescine transport system ATP-binding protein